MTTHELAELLLTLPDVPAVIFGKGSDLIEVDEVTIIVRQYIPLTRLGVPTGEVACLT